MMVLCAVVKILDQIGWFRKSSLKTQS